MPQIPIADKTTLDAVNTKVGAATDISSTASIFGRIKQIYDYLTTYWTSARAAILDTISSSISTINTKIGANTDTAGTTTVFARLAQIASLIDGLPKHARTVYGSYTTTSTTLVTAYSYSGKGFLKYVTIQLSYGTGTVEIWLDGILVRTLVSYSYETGSSGSVTLDARFTSSIILKVKTNSTSYQATCSWAIRL